MENEVDRDESAIFNELLIEKERLATEGKYLEANEIKERINSLKIMSTAQKKSTLSEYQDSENQRLEEEYEQEYKAVCDYWDDKVAQYQDNAKRNEEEMIKAHNASMEALINDLTSKYKPIKFSKDYIELKAVEGSLARQEKFKEAHYYKAKCDKLEQAEMDKYIKLRNESIQQKGEALGYKQTNERKVFKQRFETNLDLLTKQKEKDLEKLEMKYRNKRNDLGDIHRRQLKITQNENQLRARATAKKISSSAQKRKTSNGSMQGRLSYNNYPQTYSQKSLKSKEEHVLHSNIDFDVKDERNSLEEGSDNQIIEQPNEVNTEPTNQNGHIEEDEEKEHEEHTEEEGALQDPQSHKQEQNAEVSESHD